MDGMTFTLPEKIPNLPDALFEAEAKAPVALKTLLIQAANELQSYHRICFESARELEEAAALRAGQHDSDSKRDDVQKQARLTMTRVATRLKAL